MFGNAEDKATLLAVDDRPDNLFVLEQLIADGLPGCRVVTATSAKEGLAIAAAAHPDGALIDVQLPGMDGLEMCRQLKADRATRNVHVILITAHDATARLRAEGLNAGADDFIGKPVDNVELIARLKAMLRVRRAEDALREMNEHLEALVQERTCELRQELARREQATEEKAELEEQYRQAQKMESIGRLAGGVAHDFNNLLTVINSYADLAIAELRDEDPMKADLQQIADAGQRGAALTRQLLAFSRKQILEPRVLDLNAVVGELEKMLRRLIGEDIELVTVLADDLGRVTADPGQIEQVLMNLAVNARDAMHGGGKLVIETANVWLDEEHARRHPDTARGHYVAIAVTDDGTGVPPDVKERIFEPFYTTKETGKGTGLGLATVYGIVKQSGGSIQVESEPGRGATFRVYLPRVEAEEAEPRRETQLHGLQGTETILVVEDEPAVRNLTARILTSSGYQVVTAANASEALLECERRGSDLQLLLTDVVMPKMSGKELVDRLAHVSPGLRVLYMSGYPDDAIGRRDALGKAIHLLEKPFDRTELLQKVRRALGDG